MTKETIFELYDHLKIGANETCQKCISHNSTSFSKPMSLWYVGTQFKDDSQKILFVGKVARGTILSEKSTSKNFLDVTNEGERFISQNKWAFWSYTRNILENVYGNCDEGVQKTAFSNLIKCNDSLGKDKTLKSTKNYCLNELGVFWKEVAILNPKKIIFYTGKSYDSYIEKYMPSLKFKDISDKTSYIYIGAKKMPYWHRTFFDKNNNVILEFLRVGHPERKKKKEFVLTIENWIKGTNNSLNNA